MSIRMITFSLFLFLSSVVAGFVDQQATAQEPAKIGVIHPLSGYAAFLGRNSRQAFELAREDVNKAGGIKALGGAPIEIIFADDQGRPDVGIGEAERLIERERVLVMSGTSASAVAIAATEVADRTRTPWVIDVAAPDGIFARKPKYVVSINMPNTVTGRWVPDYLDYLKSLGKPIEKVALLYLEGEFGESFISGARETLKSKGFRIVADLSYPIGVKDLTPQVSKIKASGAEALIAVSLPADAILLVRTMDQLGVKLVRIGIGGAYTFPLFRQNAGPLANGWNVVNYWNDDLPGAKEVARRYKERYKMDLDGLAAMSYQAVWVIKEALEKAGSRDKEAINRALHEMAIREGHPRLVMPDDVIQFDEIGRNIGARPIITQIQAGQVVTLFPTKYATGKPLLE